MKIQPETKLYSLYLMSSGKGECRRGLGTWFSIYLWTFYEKKKGGLEFLGAVFL